VQVEGSLICRGQGAVDRVGEHRLALGAVLWIAGLFWLYAAELVMVCHCLITYLSNRYIT
jgi:hypothetical protein